MRGITNALQSVLKLTQKVRHATLRAENQNAILKPAETFLSEKGPAESQQDSMNFKKDSADSFKAPTSYFYKVHMACNFDRSALESSSCRRPRDGLFFDAKRTWYRFLKDFSVHREDVRRLLPCDYEKDAAEVLDIVPSSSHNAAADQSWSLLEARLCNQAQLHALQDKFCRSK